MFLKFDEEANDLLKGKLFVIDVESDHCFFYFICGLLSVFICTFWLSSSFSVLYYLFMLVVSIFLLRYLVTIHSKNNVLVQYYLFL